MCKAIYFDMDGTIADLYGVEDWENKLVTHDVTPYQEAAPLCNMQALNEVCEKLQNLGVVIGIISWLAIGSTKAYDKETRKAKKEWIKNNLPCVSEIHLLKYGSPKHHACKIKDDAIIVDDSKAVRAKWTRGETINPECVDIVEELEKVLTKQAAQCIIKSSKASG